MIDLYSFPTPNGRKVHLMLVECGLEYRAHNINIGKGEQFAPEFLRVSPNGRIPAIVDHDSADGKPLSVFESGAILWYLAEKTGRFLPADARGRYATMEWLMFQMAGVGPMFGQANHFRHYAPEPIPYGINRYTNEVKRLLKVLESRLSTVPYVAGDEYGIADMATYPWIVSSDIRKESAGDWPAVAAWVATIAARPAVAEAWKILSDGIPEKFKPDAKARELLFGSAQIDRLSSS
ncbi:MAG: glutathione S-transferase N-terminal domain-containing protein [Gammaproteobacteria bacterium]